MSLSRSVIVSIMMLLAVAAVGCSDDGDRGSQGEQGEPGEPGEQGPPGEAEDPSTSVEACAGCHGQGMVSPVYSVEDPNDVHFIDADGDVPQTESGYRVLDVELTEVSVVGPNLIIDFDVNDENSVPVVNLFEADGRFTIARLVAGVDGDADDWESLINTIEDPGDVGPGPGNPEVQATSESFASGNFANLGFGSYTYTSSFEMADADVPIASGETIRVAVQISAGDIPAGNGWCDFDANFVDPNACGLGTTLSLDVVQTNVCNNCHGTTADTRLAVHGGGRTEVEYCVTCHNPGSTDANTGNTVDMKVMIHKIHRGSKLSNLPYQIYGFRDSVHDYSYVNFTKEIDNCLSCHTDDGSGADEGNWSSVPTQEACGSCHDDVDFVNGINHGQYDDNLFCVNCHPATGVVTAGLKPVESVHVGVARTEEASRYAAPDRGYWLESVDPGPGSDELTVVYSVRDESGRMDLVDAPEWQLGSSLSIEVGWDTTEYTNEGSGKATAQPIAINALRIGPLGNARHIGNQRYEAIITLPSGASNTATVFMIGWARGDINGNGNYNESIPITSVFEYVEIEGDRAVEVARRVSVDSDKCNACHDAAGHGISVHGDQMTGEVQVCVVCHNADVTDLRWRPDDPDMAIDGKVEEAVDFKHMIHKIHSGKELQDGFVIYGFFGVIFDFSNVGFIGNRANCLTCHNDDTYSTELAAAARPTTIDTGEDIDSSSDDLNISPTASVCSSCHDDDVSRAHMESNGASFHALDEDLW